MCIYVLDVPLCGHSPALLFGPSCRAFLSQLGRIVEPPAWELPGLHRLPFRLPDACLPSRRNVAVVQSPHFCPGCRADLGCERRQQGAEGAEGAEREEGGGGECSLGRWPGLEMYWEPERIGVGWRT